jgi:hypothetical protein
MFPHFCGNPLHDILHNAIVLMAMAPEWLPSLRFWAKMRLMGHSHEGGHQTHAH